MSIGLFTKYCIDTCALLDIFGRKFPRDLYTDLWPSFEAAVARGEIISVREVYQEIQRRDDAVVQWAKGHTEFFVDPDESQLSELACIVNRHPDCLDILKRKPALADPWVISAASAWGLTVVTSESPDSPRKIPGVCSSEGIPCVDLFGMFRGLNWRFVTGGNEADDSECRITD
jgi:hypothetical protein